LVIFLITNLTFAYENKSSPEYQAFMKDYENGLTDFLLQHESPDVNIEAINKKLTSLGIAPEEEKSLLDYQELGEMIDEIVKNETLSTRSLMIAAQICGFNQEMFNYCNFKAINKKLIQSEPKNLAVYLISLSKSYDNSDEEKIIELIKKMSKTEYTDTHFISSQELEEAIEQYIKNNTVPTKFIDEDIKQITNFSEALSPDVMKSLSENHDYYLFATYNMMFSFMGPFPRLRAITQTCKQYEQLAPECEKVANVMINHSKTMIFPMLGHAIKSEILTHYYSPEQIEKNNSEQQKLKSQFSCLTEIRMKKEHLLDEYLDPQYYNQWKKFVLVEGEFEAMKKMAQINYQKQLDIGNENAVNPQACFE
ncbi:MAG TPA: hypothetical protein PK055_09605, partial [Gammaproteobacteria bacterium]|nr:hypothetical protein [Xanthomonadales bacterium]HOP22522.1 hypothetical protein [Gammaproteobacteria bacterium]HPQ87899.1 hypothetical protein [Gammaproteobacteria bacterium]